MQWMPEGEEQNCWELLLCVLNAVVSVLYCDAWSCWSFGALGGPELHRCRRESGCRGMTGLQVGSYYCRGRLRSDEAVSMLDTPRAVDAASAPAVIVMDLRLAVSSCAVWPCLRHSRPASAPSLQLPPPPPRQC